MLALAVLADVALFVAVALFAVVAGALFNAVAVVVVADALSGTRNATERIARAEVMWLRFMRKNLRMRA